MPKNKIATISATAMPLRRADEDASETASAEVPEPLLATTDCGAMGASTGRLMVDAAVGAEAWAGIAALGVADFVDQIATEAAVRAALDPLEPTALIEPSRRAKLALGPQNDPAVAGSAREAYACLDQLPSQSQSARRRFDQEQAQLGYPRRRAHPHKENRADDAASLLGNPATLAPGIELLDEFAGNSGYQRFEARVVTVFALIQHTVSVHDPADVARLRCAQQ